MPLILASGSLAEESCLRTPQSHLLRYALPILLSNAARRSPFGVLLPTGKRKSKAVSEAGHWVLAADTIVVQGNQVFEKPKDAGHALEMLSILAKSPHHVISAWCLRNCDNNDSITGHSISTVRFRDVRTNELKAYVASGECFDKAGAYGIQGLGAVLIDEN